LICPNCTNSVLAKSFSKPLYFNYRGFKKLIGYTHVLECSYCSYESEEGLDEEHTDTFDEMLFKREINTMLSIGEVI
jgi:hypothetical protein